jgi:hypothetical protein
MVEARSADPTLPVIEALENNDEISEQTGAWSVTGLGIVGLCVAVGFVIYRFLRSRRQ